MGTHAALCSFTGGVTGGGSPESQAGAAALPAGAGRAVPPRARRLGLARIPPSSSRPPSSSQLGPQPRSTSLIFSKLPRPGPFVPLGPWYAAMGAKEGSPPRGIVLLLL